MSSNASTATAASATQKPLIEWVRLYFESRDLIRRGICYLHAGLYADAASLFLAAREKHGNHAPISALLTSAYVGQGDFNAAADELGAAAQDQPANTEAQRRHALGLWRSGRRYQAVGLLRDALKDAPDCLELHFHLGSFLAAMEDWETAELHLTQAVAIDKNHVESLVNLAMLHAARHQPEESVRYLGRAQRLRPTDAKIGWLLSMALQAARATGSTVSIDAAMPTFREDDGQLIAELHRAIKQEPELAEALLEEAGHDELINRLMGEALERLHQDDPRNPWLVYYLGRTLERMGHLEEAQAKASLALELDPQFVQAIVLLARLQHRAGQIESARQNLERAVAFGVEYADLYFQLGNIYRECGDLVRARHAYERALGINGRYEAARLALSTLAA